MAQKFTKQSMHHRVVICLNPIQILERGRALLLCECIWRVPHEELASLCVEYEMAAKVSQLHIALGRNHQVVHVQIAVVHAVFLQHLHELRDLNHPFNRLLF